MLLQARLSLDQANQLRPRLQHPTGLPDLSIWVGPRKKAKLLLSFAMKMASASFAKIGVIPIRLAELCKGLSDSQKDGMSSTGVGGMALL